MTRSTTLIVLAALSAIALPIAARGGPLSPPAGPVASTMKTLNEVEPRIAINATNTPGDADSVFKITQPGSYFLTGNITGVSGKSGIEVAASNVVIDLNGFNVAGVASSLTGILAYPSSRVTVKNGSVTSWGQRGVDIGAGGVVADLAVDHCGGNGINTTRACRVERCNSVANSGTGIAIARGSIVSDAVITANGAYGILASEAATLSRCVASENTLSGIFAGSGSLVESCTCVANLQDGITANDECTLTANACDGNGDDGIEIANGCMVTRNHCSNNDPNGNGGGVYAPGNSNHIEDNLFVGNNRGVFCSGAHNFIVKNTARANIFTNFSIVAGNETAPVIFNPGNNAFATMTPWSNVSY